jgi:hypothetical protein
MNCNDFNEIIDDLADYKPMSATIRDASVSHAALCPDCAAKLASARAVAGCLLEAARAESEQAPVQVKENLLTAFAEFQQQQAAPKRVVDISSRRPKHSWLAVAAAVAAVILLALAVSVWKKAAVSGSQPHDDLNAGVPRTPQVDGPKPGSSPNKKMTIDEGVKRTAKNSTSSRSVKRVRHESVGGPQEYATVAQNSGAYLPLTYLAKGTAIDSGTVVRVELSRAALASLGFAGSVESSAEHVKAEVILGDDGVARAIRLVE